jgi:LacI family transcriptional regulator
MSRARIGDVAALAGVSVGTVSNVLNRPSVVRVATRLRVERAIDELGFVPNASARQLKAGRSSIVAYVLLDAGNPFFTDVARGVEHAVREEGLSLFLCNTDQDPTREDEYLRNLAELRVRGLLITPANTSSAKLLDLRRRGIPVVLLDRVLDDDRQHWCAVGVDDVQGGELAVEHLLDRGHRRICFVGGPQSIPQVADRHLGGARAIERTGLAPDALTSLPTSGLGFNDGRLAGERLLGLPGNRRPTAAFCANDLVALGLLQHLTRARLRVPGDFAIVGYDDIEYASAAAVPLSSVAQPRYELGRAAAELLLDEAEQGIDHEHRRLVFAPELIARASSGTTS